MFAFKGTYLTKPVSIIKVHALESICLDYLSTATSYCWWKRCIEHIVVPRVWFIEQQYRWHWIVGNIIRRDLKLSTPVNPYCQTLAVIVSPVPIWPPIRCIRIRPWPFQCISFQCWYHWARQCITYKSGHLGNLKTRTLVSQRFANALFHF